MKWVVLGCLVAALVKTGESSAIRCPPHSKDTSCSEESIEQDLEEKPRPQAECLAGSKWESNCHSCQCSESGKSECLKQADCNHGVLELRREKRAEKSEMKTGEQCVPGSTWQNDCNSCFCSNEGYRVCTKKQCYDKEGDFKFDKVDSEDKVEDYTDIKYDDEDQRIKEVIKAFSHNLVKRSACKPNQDFQSECNSCKCSADGQHYTCTQNECLERDMNKEVEVFMETEGVDHIERHSVCQPSDTFYIGCNTCKCNFDGTDYSCTNKPCPLPEDVELFHELREMKPIIPYKEYDDNEKSASGKKTIRKSSINNTNEVLCVANRMFIKDCNTCWCNDDGTGYFCTRKICVPGLPIETSIEEKDEKETKTSINGTARVICVANRMFLKDCNTCWCNNDGTGYSCTRKVCILENPDDIDFGDEKPEELRILKKECRPDEVFELDCNMCRCNPDGKSFSCTRRACVDPEDGKNTTSVRKIRSTQKETYNNACQPGQVFRFDCNHCLCDDTGKTFSCTRNDCNANNNNNGGGRSKRETSEVKEIATECTPGSVFEQECNACRCTADGHHAICSTKSCHKVAKENSDVQTSVPDPDFRCNPGEQFRRDCSDCTCAANGKNYFCTVRLCDITPDPNWV